LKLWTGHCEGAGVAAAASAAIDKETTMYNDGTHIFIAIPIDIIEHPRPCLKERDGCLQQRGFKIMMQKRVQ
jgi:hypothetical protein